MIWAFTRATSCQLFFNTRGGRRSWLDKIDSSNHQHFHFRENFVPHFKSLSKWTGNIKVWFASTNLHLQIWRVMKYRWHVKVLVSVFHKSSTESTVCFVDGINSNLIWYFPRWVYFFYGSALAFCCLWYHIFSTAREFFFTLIYASDSFLLSSVLPLFSGTAWFSSVYDSSLFLLLCCLNRKKHKMNLF